MSVKVAYHDMNHAVEISQRADYKIPRILWENMEAVLLSQSKKYIEELAKVLQVPAKELQKRVMPSANTVKVILQDVQEHVCQAYIQNGKFTVFCRKPVFDSHYCAAHTANRMLVHESAATTIKRVKDIDTLPPMWIQKDTLYTASGQKIGKVNHVEQKIKIYVLENA